MNSPALREQHSSSGVTIESADRGQADSLRYNVLTYVVEEKYEQAIETLNNFIVTPSDYPNFRQRLERYISHSVDLINAIRAKRNFPGMNSLTKAKQQELTERYREHFEELTVILKKIEKIQGDLRIEDVRSTVWVVKALANGIFAVLAMALILEVYNGLARTTIFVVDDYFTRFINWVFGLIGF